MFLVSSCVIRRVMYRLLPEAIRSTLHQLIRPLGPNFCDNDFQDRTILLSH